MPRAAWSSLVVLLLAFSLASCFNDETTCSTCPPDHSARIEVEVTQNGTVDSAQVAVDGGATLSVRRGQRGGIGGLSRGTHRVDAVRWFDSDGISIPRVSSFQIQLEQGEIRLIVFHKDFPLVAWAPILTSDRAANERMAGPAPQRGG